MVYFAQSVEYLIAGRLLAGICGGGIYILHPLFISEYSDAKWVAPLYDMTTILTAIKWRVEDSKNWAPINWGSEKLIPA